MKKLLLIFFLFFAGLIFSEGFIAGTLVKTSHGYTAIENLSVGDFVVCFDDDMHCVERPITHIASVNVLRYVLLYTDDECIGVSIDQQLHVEDVQKWVTVSKLRCYR
jgi:hypothetical protein